MPLSSQHPDMAQHAALFPVYRYIKMLLKSSASDSAECRADSRGNGTGRFPSPRRTRGTSPRRTRPREWVFRRPARAVAAAVALRKPTEFFHRCLTLADAGKTPISAHRHTPQDGRAYAHAVHRVFRGISEARRSSAYAPCRCRSPRRAACPERPETPRPAQSSPSGCRRRNADEYRCRSRADQACSGNGQQLDRARPAKSRSGPCRCRS